MTRTERQRLALKKWKQNHCRGSIVCPTGFGKSRTSLIAIQKVIEKNPTAKVVIIVPTKALQKQWNEHLTNWNLPGQVVIINTAAKQPFDCDFLVMDECQHYSSDVFSKMLKNCTPSFILGLTATYERLDGKEKILEQYAPVCDTVSVEEAVKNGWLAPYRKYKVLLRVDLTEYEKANQTFLSSFSFFNFDWEIAMKALTGPEYQAKLAKLYNCDIKQVKANAYSFNRSLQFRKKFIANHSKKLEIAKKILDARTDKKCITFNGSIDFCKKYESGYLLHSKQKAKENEKILDKFNACTTGVLHTSKMADEGLDVPGLSVGIITGFNSSKITAVQRAGRVLRYEDGKTAELFILVLKGTVEEQWFKKSQEDQEFIEIDENELQLVLENKPIQSKVQKQEKSSGFRY